LRELIRNGTNRAEAPRRSTIKIVVGGNRRILVPRGFDAETLRQVIEVLESASC
jgi:hypothetical protein